MLVRQKVLLHLVSEAGHGLKRTHLMKLAFLLSKQKRSRELATFYQFLPYRFGPFSFTLARDLSSLCHAGYLVERNTRVFTPTGGELPHLNESVRTEVHHLLSEFGGVPATDLVNFVYAQFPQYTVNSAIPHKRRADRRVAEPAVFTIGYEGLQVDGLLNTLVNEGVSALVDVRSNPVSRRYGFHKTTLMTLAHHVGVDYTHWPGVGVPGPLRREMHSVRGLDRLFRCYASEVLPREEEAVNAIADLMKKTSSALLCMERNPYHCHRHILADVISERTGMEVRHLGRGCDSWQLRPMY